MRSWIWLLLACTTPLLAVESPELSSAIDLYHKKDYEAAANALHALQQKSPDDPAVNYYLGRTARKQNNLDEAIQALERATQLDPKNVDYFIALGDAYGAVASKSRSFAAAQRSCMALEQAVNLAPTNEEARAALIDFCRRAPSIVGGGMQRAYDQAKDFRIKEPVAGTRLLVALYESEKRYDEAYNLCLDTLKTFPDDYTILYTVGRLAARTGSHLEEGIADLEKCLTLPVPPKFPNHAAAHVRLGQLFSQEGDTANAQKHFQAALADEPQNKDAQNGLALLATPH